MKKCIALFIGLIMLLGTTSCNPSELPTATSTGIEHPEITLTTSIDRVNPTLTEYPAPTETKIPTRIQTKSSNTPTPQVQITLSTDICHETAGWVEAHQVDSQLLEGDLEFIVYLPPCYAALSDQRYPVLYLFHGQTFSNQHWIDLGVIALADRLIANGELAPFIMVFPHDIDHYKPPPENPFGAAILADLIPTVDQTFRTIPTRAYRAIGGISRGGNWAAHIGLQHPELFSAVGLHSTPIFSTDTNREIREWLQAIPVDELPRLFLDTARSDRWLNYTLVFEALLNDAGVPHEWYLFQGFHEDDYWESHLELYLRWYAEPWRVDNGTQ